jgi:hypothetical protein
MSKADKSPPAKKRALRTRQAKAIDEDHDADDDEEAEGMLVVQSNYNRPHSTSPFHGVEKRLEARQPTEEISSEEQYAHSHNLQLSFPVQHSSGEYDFQEPISRESASEERYLEQGSRGYSSQEDRSSRKAASPRKFNPPLSNRPTYSIHKPYFLTPKPRPKPKTGGTSYSKSVDPKPMNSEPSAEAVKEREELYERMFGEKIPPQWRDALKQTIGRSSPKLAENHEDEEDDGDSDKSYSFLDEPKLTSAEWAAWREEQRELRGHTTFPITPPRHSEVCRFAKCFLRGGTDILPD